MASFLEQVSLATNIEFVKRVQQALVKCALAVMAEAGDTAGHAERAALAQRVLSDPLGAARNMAFGVASGVITEYSSDSDLEWMAASVWNAYAGV
jgi:hypothetical protein